MGDLHRLGEKETDMALDITDMMTPEEAESIGLDSMSEQQKRCLNEWGMRLFSMGQHVVAEIDKVKYDGRLVILDDGSRWTVDDGYTDISEVWDYCDRVVVIDDCMYKLDESEMVAVEEGLD